MLCTFETMATRAPHNLRNSPGSATAHRSAAPAGRGGVASRAGSGTGSPPRPRRPASRQRGPQTGWQARKQRSPGRKGRPPGRRNGARKRAGGSAQRPPDPFMILFGWVAKAASAAWMVAAHGVGFVARAIGRSARDLDPLHRRDGIGLAVLGAAIVTAATTWWHLGSVVGSAVSALVSGAFGAAAWSVPMLLGLLSWRYLRHPDRNAETGRMVIGWSALIVGALGLVHIANGTPPPTAGGLVMRSAGGFIGFFASAPLVAAVTPWIAAPLLALLCGFGLLVITATPLHRIPDRLADLHGFVRRDPVAATDAGEGAGDSAEGALGPGSRGTADARRRSPGTVAGQLLRGGRARRPALEPGEHERPYDTPLLSGAGQGADRAARERDAAARGLLRELRGDEHAPGKDRRGADQDGGPGAA